MSISSIEELDGVVQKEISKIYEQLYKYAEMRNSIAHCNDRYQDGEYMELVFVLLRAMYILKFDADISQIFLYGGRDRR